MKNAFLRVDKIETNSESFGWWLSDLLPDKERPPRISEPIGKNTRGYDNRAYRPGSQLVSETALTPGNKLERTDLEDNTTVNKKCEKTRSVINKTKNVTPVCPFTTGRSVTRHLQSKATSKNKKVFVDSTLPTLTGPDSSNHKQPDRVFNLRYLTHTEITKSGRQFKRAIPSDKSKQHQSASRTDLKEVGTTSQVDGDHKELSPFVGLALSTEHDTDRELEQPRGQFLQVVSGLDCQVTGLLSDSTQLHTCLNKLHQDFQVSGANKTDKSSRFSIVGDKQSLRSNINV
jgi:hypothetical protein